MKKKKKSRKLLFNKEVVSKLTIYQLKGGIDPPSKHSVCDDECHPTLENTCLSFCQLSCQPTCGNTCATCQGISCVVC